MKRMRKVLGALACVLVTSGGACDIMAQSASPFGSAPVIMLEDGGGHRTLNDKEVQALLSSRDLKYLTFYEGESKTQDIVCSLVFEHAGTWNSGKFGSNIACTNDEAKSLQFVNANPGTVIEVWNGGNCQDDIWSKGHSVITNRRKYHDNYVAHFEQSRNDEWFLVNVYGNSINGQISCFILRAT